MDKTIQSKFTLVPAILIALLSLFTVVVCTMMHVSYFASTTLVLVYIIAGAFFGFEKKRPSARQVVVVSTICAIAICSRVAFIWLPFFKPMAAIVMLAGISFGARMGFMTGSVSVLVSNIFFGQGPWTPWQMTAFGIVGLIMGALADKGIIKRSAYTRRGILLLACGGFLLCVLISGPILDLYALFSMIAVFNLESAVSVLLAGFPINCAQGIAVALTLAFVGNPLLGILEKVKVRYGIAA